LTKKEVEISCMIDGTLSKLAFKILESWSCLILVVRNENTGSKTNWNGKPTKPSNITSIRLCYLRALALNGNKNYRIEVNHINKFSLCGAVEKMKCYFKA
jgi:hypothetical protein